jgi:nicotinamide-nucleotide adenylyltransferase
MRGLYIGRFQPYHLGHEAVLKAIAKDLDEIVIVIGSAQESHTRENPFTAGERLEMICSALEEADLRSRCFVVPLQDVKRNAIWVSHLRSMVPHFDLAYSNNPLVLQLFQEAGVEVRRPLMYQRDLYSGTAIRRLMLERGDWKSLVPGPIASFILKMEGIARMANVSRSDVCRQEWIEDF